jgi:hypothetical protein
MEEVPPAPTSNSDAADFPWDLSEESERRVRGRMLQIAGVICIVLGVAVMWFSPHLIPFLRGGQGTGGSITGRIVFAAFALGIGILCKGVLNLNLSRQYFAPSADELLRRDPRPPVVYLRTFDADDIDPPSPTVMDYIRGEGTFEETFGATEEEQLALAMNELGPFIAIGRPYDPLPKLGAARVRVSDDQWQAKVAEWMKRAGLVVLRLGMTEGIEWETAHIGEHVSPEKIVLLLPFTPANGYNELRDRLSSHFRRGLPAVNEHSWTAPRSICGLVYFSPDWTPHFVALRRSDLNSCFRAIDSLVLATVGRALSCAILFIFQPRFWLTTTFKHAFQPVIQQRGWHWKRPAFLHVAKPALVTLLLFALCTFLALDATSVSENSASAKQLCVDLGELETSTDSNLWAEMRPELLAREQYVEDLVATNAELQSQLSGDRAEGLIFIDECDRLAVDELGSAASNYSAAWSRLLAFAQSNAALTAESEKALGTINGERHAALIELDKYIADANGQLCIK